MKTSAEAPRRRAASATAWAWFPALAAQTPAASSPGESAAMAFDAPRILNEPVRCRHSAFRVTGASKRRESSPAASTGVRLTRGPISSAARSISATVTGSSRMPARSATGSTVAHAECKFRA